MNFFDSTFLFRTDMFTLSPRRDSWHFRKLLCLGKKLLSRGPNKHESIIQNPRKIIDDKLREILSESGDAVSVDELLERLPHLSREVILRAAGEDMRDVVVFELEGIEYLKLLEAYYLPEDFSAAVTANWNSPIPTTCLNAV